MVSLGSNLPGGGASRNSTRAGWFAALESSPRPAVVDYTVAGDRVELSGRVLANWGAKTANLVDAEGYGPGSTVLVDLPLGWTSLAVLLGLARAGVAVSFPEPDDGPAPGATAAGTARRGTPDAEHVDLVISGAPGDWADHPADLWAVDLRQAGDEHGAAGQGDGTEAPDTPDHAVDFLTEVRMQADRCPLPMPGGPGGDDGTGGLEALAGDWEQAGGAAPGSAVGTGRRLAPRERGLAVAAARTGLDLTVARAAARTWDRGRPVVLLPETTTAFGPESTRTVEAEGLGGAVGQD